MKTGILPFVYCRIPRTEKCILLANVHEGHSNRNMNGMIKREKSSLLF